ncbi:MAG: hypothetical protein KDA62_03350 [Planctomycetales bacterium]|nr:hypothetical protein [Planctomycetales bacterium]
MGEPSYLLVRRQCAGGWEELLDLNQVPLELVEFRPIFEIHRWPIITRRGKYIVHNGVQSQRGGIHAVPRLFLQITVRREFGQPADDVMGFGEYVEFIIRTITAMLDLDVQRQQPIHRGGKV